MAPEAMAGRAKEIGWDEEDTRTVRHGCASLAVSEGGGPIAHPDSTPVDTGPADGSRSATPSLRPDSVRPAARASLCCPYQRFNRPFLRLAGRIWGCQSPCRLGDARYDILAGLRDSNPLLP